MGIPEYWIVDYAALGSREIIGNPKQPTLTICSLDEGEYRVSKFRASECLSDTLREQIYSPTFPDLNLTAGEIFQGRSNFNT